MRIDTATRMLIHAACAALLFALPIAAFAASTPAARVSSLEQSDRALSARLTRASEFADVPHISQAEACEQVELPVALATPDPLSVPSGHGKHVAISFIIGTDGRVHSPLILQSAGLSGDRRVLQTVRTWRYRPGTCNGVPTETEGKVQFSIP